MSFLTSAFLDNRSMTKKVGNVSLPHVLVSTWVCYGYGVMCARERERERDFLFFANTRSKVVDILFTAESCSASELILDAFNRVQQGFRASECR